MMTPAQFKAARAAVIEASKWNASRIRGEMAECIEISNTTEVHVAVPAVVRERAEAIALAGGWCVSTRETGDRVILDLETGGPAANVDLEIYREPIAIPREPHEAHDAHVVLGRGRQDMRRFTLATLLLALGACDVDLADTTAPALVLLIVIVAWVIHDRWTAAQAARALEVAAAQASATALATSVGEVATGLVGLRAEVHSLRGALQDHATATDERLRHHEAGLGELRSEVSHVRGRVDVLESSGTRPSASARARRPT